MILAKQKDKRLPRNAAYPLGERFACRLGLYLGVLASWRLGGAQTVVFKISRNHALEENRPRLANQVSYTDGGLKQWLPHASHVIVSIYCRVFYGNE